MNLFNLYESLPSIIAAVVGASGAGALMKIYYTGRTAKDAAEIEQQLTAMRQCYDLLNSLRLRVDQLESENNRLNNKVLGMMDNRRKEDRKAIEELMYLRSEVANLRHELNKFSGVSDGQGDEFPN